MELIDLHRGVLPLRTLWSLVAAILLSGFAAADYAAPVVQVFVDGIPLQVEVADTPAEQALGLMYRTDLEPGEGMLFVYPKAKTLTFWMKDTPLDLDIAFFDETGRLLNIESMTALDASARHTSKGPARYALETRRGWFAARGLGPGAHLELPDGLR